jgi:hypothetical protein
MVRVLLLLLPHLFLLLRFVKRRHFGPLEVCTIRLSTTGSSMVPSKKKKEKAVIWRDLLIGDTSDHLKNVLWGYRPQGVQWCHQKRRKK